MDTRIFHRSIKSTLMGGDFNVGTSIHIKETIPGSDAHQVFNASPTSVLLDT